MLVLSTRQAITSAFLPKTTTSTSAAALLLLIQRRLACASSSAFGSARSIHLCAHARARGSIGLGNGHVNDLARSPSHLQTSAPILVVFLGQTRHLSSTGPTTELHIMSPQLRKRPSRNLSTNASGAPSSATPPSSTSAAGQQGSTSSGKPPLSHSHSHSHSHGDHAEEAAALLSALRGSSDPGSRITLIGLGANVGLTAVKGVAGWILGSAALLADAAHSGSDLLADVVTLTTYRMSRKPVSVKYPYGYGKYESVGSLVVSILLIGTALGIGKFGSGEECLHSYHLLLTTLATMPNMNPELLASLDLFPHGHSHGGVSDHSHDHHGSSGEAEIVDPRAMWFAAGSIAVKEYLYRATLKVAKSEHSNVLLANALHHRSDAFGSLVAVGAIAGAYFGFPVLDPLGGLLVSGMVLKQGAGVGVTALKELVDQVTDPSLPPRIHSAILKLRDPSLPSLPPYTQLSSSSLSSPSTSGNPSNFSSADHSLHATEASEAELEGTFPILSILSIRVMASGPSLLVDVVLGLPDGLTLKECAEVEKRVSEVCRSELGGKDRVREVVVRMVGERAEEMEE
ncbi:BZ3500_MvSof-1268-A1-R1_Chr2-3g05361 [Microbotryum saponariae]|uniref:BZ3500_MvSof-1268-A1-R1_Chr2-3g05361 protein n=1 Tax=Microbotryum saponariae TaxID=289078 RepID=A0A2X0KXQ1_9BASI|nr:BZ3500_MvSof-1268-A1-R1_Chr2-3g05361 [Microbotryum saponariae]SDA01278.1 BZ3501_MvSof-1269-A2-R1_Chr2-2g05034 [Microbotryum saponariae]